MFHEYWCEWMSEILRNWIFQKMLWTLCTPLRFFNWSSEKHEIPLMSNNPWDVTSNQVMQNDAMM